MINDTKKSKPDNITDEIRERILSTAQERSLLIDGLIENLEPDYEYKRGILDIAMAEYKQVSIEMESLKKELEEQVQIIKMFGALTDENSPQVLQYNNKLSEQQANEEANEKRQRIKSPKLISWLSEAVLVLKQHYEFMAPELVIEKILQKADVLEKLKQSTKGNDPVHYRKVILNNFLSHAEKTAEGYKGKLFKPVLTIYKEKIGLAVWIGINGKPNDGKLERGLKANVIQILPAEEEQANFLRSVKS